MRTHQIAGHVPSQQAACLLSGSCDKSEGGEEQQPICEENAPDIANTELTAAVNTSHNKGKSRLLPGMCVDGWEMTQVCG